MTAIADAYAARAQESETRAKAVRRILVSTICAKYYQGGRAVRESTGTTKETVARRILRSREGDVEKGIPIVPQMGIIAFDGAADDLLNDYRINRKA
jgi:hypothetical protein